MISKVCERCEKRESCMGQLSLYKPEIFGTLALAEESGGITAAQMPIEFSRECIHPERFISEANQNLYIAKTGRKLFEEDLYAFDNGGVVPAIQKNYSVLLNRPREFHLDEEKTKFLDKVYYVLKNADIDELIEASHEDSAWIEKSNNYYLDREKMNSLAHADEYRKQYSDMLKVMDSLPL